MFILGPGARALRDQIRDSIAFLDGLSGDSVHWLLLDNPKRCRPHIDALLRLLDTTRDELDRVWDRALAQRADGDDVISEAEAAAVAALNLAPARLPVAVALFSRDQWLPMTISLPKASAHDPEIARRALEILQKAFAPARLKGALTVTPGKRTSSPSRFVINLCAGVKRELQTLDPQQMPKLGREARADRTLELHNLGYTIERLITELGMSRPTVYRDLRLARKREAERNRR